MKNIFLLACVMMFIQACSSSDSLIVLNASQSMSITGKGPGQDAAYNPYADENSMAVVKNLGKNSFNVRIQNRGKIIENITIRPEEKRKLPLPKGYELYFDSELKSKAYIDFRKDKM